MDQRLLGKLTDDGGPVVIFASRQGYFTIEVRVDLREKSQELSIIVGTVTRCTGGIGEPRLKERVRITTPHSSYYILPEEMVSVMSTP